MNLTNLSVFEISKKMQKQINGGGFCDNIYVTVNGTTRTFESESLAQSYTNAWTSLGAAVTVTRQKCYNT